LVLSQVDLELLKELNVAGERGRTGRPCEVGVALPRLVKAGYVIERKMGRNLIEYRITRRGDDALAEHV
jgi:hypothetical protein